MPDTPSNPRSRGALARVDALKAELAELGLACSGTLSRRMMKCGKSYCRCHVDVAARHGPYYEWTRIVKGRFTNTMLSEAEAERFASAIKNMREARRLLRAWERISITLLRDPAKRKPRKGNHLREKESRSTSAE